MDAGKTIVTVSTTKPILVKVQDQLMDWRLIDIYKLTLDMWTRDGWMPLEHPRWEFAFMDSEGKLFIRYATTFQVEVRGLDEERQFTLLLDELRHEVEPNMIGLRIRGRTSVGI